MTIQTTAALPSSAADALRRALAGKDSDLPQLLGYDLFTVTGLGDRPNSCTISKGDEASYVATVLGSYVPVDRDTVFALRAVDNWVVLGSTRQVVSSLTEARVKELIDNRLDERMTPRVRVQTSNIAPAGPGWKQESGGSVYIRDDGDGAATINVVIGSGSAAPSQPATPSGKVPPSVTIKPTGQRGYRSGGGTFPQPKQGGTGADWVGIYTYGNAIKNACAGKTVKSMKFRAMRRNSPHGYSTGVPVNIGTHNRSSVGTGVPSVSNRRRTGKKVIQGGSVLIDLNSSERSHLAAGNGGIGVWGNGLRDYIIYSTDDNAGEVTVEFSA